MSNKLKLKELQDTIVTERKKLYEERKEMKIKIVKSDYFQKYQRSFSTKRNQFVIGQSRHCDPFLVL